MNWKQTLNPWGYAREIAEQLESEKVACEAFAEQLKATRQLLNEERCLRDDAARDNTTLKTELATALDALRIAEERADKNAAACDAAHDSISTEEDVKVFGCDLVLDESLAPTMFEVIGAIPKGTRRPKANSTEKRTATAPGGAELHLKPARQNNKAQEAAYAEAVKRKTK